MSSFWKTIKSKIKIYAFFLNMVCGKYHAKAIKILYEGVDISHCILINIFKLCCPVEVHLQYKFGSVQIVASDNLTYVCVTWK